MALIAITADKGSPGVTTTSIALAAIWPRPVLLAECDPAGGDLVYRLPGADGQRLDPRRGLLSLAVAARRGLQAHQVWQHAQKLHGGLDVLTGVTSSEQGAGLENLWGSVGSVLAALPEADVIADCGRIGADGPYYDLLAQAAAVVMVSKATLGDVVRLRERAAAVTAGVHRRGRPGVRVGVVVIADHKHFNGALAEVGQSISQGPAPASVIGGLAYEPKSADMLRGEWGGKLDKSLLIRTAREIAAHLAGQLPANAAARPAGAQAAVPAPARPAAVMPPPVTPAPVMPAPVMPAPVMPAPSAPAWPAAARPEVTGAGRPGPVTTGPIPVQPPPPVRSRPADAPACLSSPGSPAGYLAAPYPPAGYSTGEYPAAPDAAAQHPAAPYPAVQHPAVQHPEEPYPVAQHRAGLSIMETRDGQEVPRPGRGRHSGAPRGGEA